MPKSTWKKAAHGRFGDLYDSGNWFMIPKIYRIITGNGDTAILLAYLVNQYFQPTRYDYAEDNDGWFFRQTRAVEDDIGLTETQQQVAIKKLKKLGFVEVSMRGLPAKRHFRIDEQAVEDAVAEHRKARTLGSYRSGEARDRQSVGSWGPTDPGRHRRRIIEDTTLEDTKPIGLRTLRPQGGRRQPANKKDTPATVQNDTKTKKRRTLKPGGRAWKQQQADESEYHREAATKVDEAYRAYFDTENHLRPERLVQLRLRFWRLTEEENYPRERLTAILDWYRRTASPDMPYLPRMFTPTDWSQKLERLEGAYSDAMTGRNGKTKPDAAPGRWWARPYNTLSYADRERVRGRVEGARQQVGIAFERIPIERRQREGTTLDEIAVRGGLPGYHLKYWPCLAEYEGKTYANGSHTAKR